MDEYMVMVAMTDSQDPCGSACNTTCTATECTPMECKLPMHSQASTMVPFMPLAPVRWCQCSLCYWLTFPLETGELAPVSIS
eukprot:3507195-Amphidinium_carterae.1